MQPPPGRLEWRNRLHASPVDNCTDDCHGCQYSLHGASSPLDNPPGRTQDHSTRAHMRTCRGCCTCRAGHSQGSTPESHTRAQTNPLGRGTWLARSHPAARALPVLRNAHGQSRRTRRRTAASSRRRAYMGSSTRSRVLCRCLGTWPDKRAHRICTRSSPQNTHNGYRSCRRRLCCRPCQTHKAHAHSRFGTPARRTQRRPTRRRNGTDQG